jgi:hypothetical protein
MENNISTRASSSQQLYCYEKAFIFLDLNNNDKNNIVIIMFLFLGSLFASCWLVGCWIL